WFGLLAQARGGTADKQNDKQENIQLGLSLYGHALQRPPGYMSAASGSTDFDDVNRRLSLKWYHGRVDTPWHTNLLTMTSSTFSAMLNAYFPPSFSRIRYTKA